MQSNPRYGSLLYLGNPSATTKSIGLEITKLPDVIVTKHDYCHEPSQQILGEALA
jgi:uncharacterized protein YqgQ